MENGREHLRQEHLPYKILAADGSAEIVEKKSRFIATLASVETEEEAAVFLEAVKKRYWDASHNCFAFVLLENGMLQRCSDDGEPSGTAGKPMLNVLLEKNIRNAAVAVTRYFGGTLLGTGGLVRAYTQAVQAGIAAAGTADMYYGTELSVTAGYELVGKIKYILGQMDMEAADVVYTDIARFLLHVPQDREEKLRRELTEASAGKIRITEISKKYFVDK